MAMPTYATLRDQYPLSPRKFWKKIIVASISSLWLAVVLGPLVGGIYLAIVDGSQNEMLRATFEGAIGTSSIVLYVALLVSYAWFLRVYIHRYYYDANDSYLTIKKGVFAPAEIHVQYAKVQDVYVDQDILDRVMGLYDVHLASATMMSGIQAHIDGVEKDVAEGLKNMLLARIQRGPSSPTTAVSEELTVESADQPSAPINFDTEISSRTYPIGRAWLYKTAAASLVPITIISIIITQMIWVALTQIIWRPSGVFTPQLILSILLIVFVSLFVFHMLMQYLWRATFSFAFFHDYIVMKNGIIAKFETHVPYRTVQDVILSQGIFERLFGLATVRIENATFTQMPNAISIPGQPLAKAHEIRDALKRVVLKKNASHTGL